MNRSDAGLFPLVCIHGFSGSWRNWVPIVPALQTRHDVHVARLAGHARGDRLPAVTAVSVSALADQLERDLDAAGIDRAHLVGNSLGGWLSLELAARGRALSVVALSPALGWEQDRRHLKRLATKLRVGRKLYAAANPYAEFLLASKRIRKALLHGAVAHAERVSVVEAAAFLRDNLRCDNYFELMDSFLSTEHHLGDIDCPVLIAWSEDDTLIPQDPYGVRFPALVPHADVVTLPSVGHVPMYDDAGLVARTVLDYTATVDAADIVVPAAG